jgi:hypothetical protein
MFGNGVTVGEGSSGTAAVDEASHSYRGVEMRKEQGGLGEKGFAIHRSKYKGLLL